MSIDRNPQEQRQTKYARIHEELLSSISSGAYGLGTSLPPERILAKRYDVSVATVRQALGLLEKSGVVSREQGRGTIVRRREPLLDGTGSARRKGFAYVLMEREPASEKAQGAESELFRNEMRSLNRLVSARDSHIVFAQTTTKQLAEGRLPKALDKDLIGGVFLSGDVSDLDAHILREKGLPVVVMGSQSVSLSASRAYCDIEEAACLLAESLLAHNRADVAFVSEPFTYQATRLAFTGYCRAASQAGMSRTSVVLTNTGEDLAELRSALGRLKTPFAMLLANVSAYTLLDVYRELGLDLTKNPTALLGHSGNLPEAAARKLNVCSDGSEACCEAAVKLMDQTVSTGRVRTVVLKPRVESSTEAGRLVLNVHWESETAGPAEQPEEPVGSTQPWWLPKPPRNP